MPLVAALFVVVIAAVALYAAKELVEVKISKCGGKNIPGPISWPLIGSALTLAKYAQPWESFSALSKIYGDIYGIQIGMQYCVVVSSIEAMKEILIHKSADFANRPNFARFSAIFRGRRDLSVALSDWSEKQRKRRDITFPFTHPRNTSFDMNHLESCIKTTLDDLVNQLRQLNGDENGSHDALLYTSANLFYDFLCSKRYDYKNPNFVKTVRNYHVIFSDLFKGYAIDFFPWLCYFNRQILTRLYSWSEQVSEFTRPIFNEHETNLLKDNPKDLVDVLLLSGFDLSREDSFVIIEDLVGGHSALHNMWMWTMALVGCHEEVSEKIKIEVDLADPDGIGLQLKNKSQLCYTYATINEVLRVVASPIIPHRSTKKSCVQGYNIPEDTLMFFNTRGLNMDEKFWQEPLTFKPESTGKRSCLGDCIVRNTLLLGLATLVRRFDVELIEGHKYLNLSTLPGTVIFPSREIKIRFTPRS